MGGRPSVPPLRVKRNIPWRAADSRPYADTGRGPFSSQGPVPDQPAQDSHRERWFGKPRRRNKNRTSSNFFSLRPPVGPDGTAPQALLILRARKDSACPRGNPRNGVRGKGDYEHEVLIWSRPRWRFGSFAAMGKGTRRPQAAKLSPNDK